MPATPSEMAGWRPPRTVGRGTTASAPLAPVTSPPTSNHIIQSQPEWGFSHRKSRSTERKAGLSRFEKEAAGMGKTPNDSQRYSIVRSKNHHDPENKSCANSPRQWLPIIFSFLLLASASSSQLSATSPAATFFPSLNCISTPAAGSVHVPPHVPPKLPRQVVCLPVQEHTAVTLCPRATCAGRPTIQMELALPNGHAADESEEEGHHRHSPGHAQEGRAYHHDHGTRLP